MSKYIARRVIWLVVVLLVVSFITFSLMHLVPGGPWDSEKQLAPQVIENLNNKYGLDKPFFVQYFNYIWGVLHGDLGVSYSYQDRGVTQILLQGLPITATLGVVAFILAVLIGMPLGMLAALKQNSASRLCFGAVLDHFCQYSGFRTGHPSDDNFFDTFALAADRGWGSVSNW